MLKTRAFAVNIFMMLILNKQEAFTFTQRRCAIYVHDNWIERNVCIYHIHYLSRAVA